MDNGIRLNAVGQLDKLPPYVREPLEALRADSADNTGMVLTLALSYGGREELVQAAQALAEQVRAGTLEPKDVTEKALEEKLWTAGLPPVDLIIRTSGEQRMSNFLLWQGAYAELVFVDTLWPDFREQALFEALKAFQNRERRYGLTAAQVRKAAT